VYEQHNTGNEGWGFGRVGSDFIDGAGPSSGLADSEDKHRSLEVAGA
jgi:hypothetical protein